MNNINKKLARDIIMSVGSTGQPPEFGLECFTVGVEEYLNPLESEYLATYVKDGGGAFKLVVGTYGVGKTHFLYCVRERAWRNNFAVSYVSLNSESTPFHQLESVYKEIVTKLTYPPILNGDQSEYREGIGSFIKHWFENKKNDLKRKDIRGYRLIEELKRYVSGLSVLEDLSFTNAIKAAFSALIDAKVEEFDLIIQWLSGEGYDDRVCGHRKYGILHKIDKRTAFPMIRSLIGLIRNIGYPGIVVLLDEAEQEASIKGPKKMTLLSNLRELIDECTHQSLSNSMFFYAVPDETFFQGGDRIYIALNQRLATVFQQCNPVGVKILLETTTHNPLEVLLEIGKKLAGIFEICYEIKFIPHILENSIENIAKAAWQERFGEIGYKRLFVQTTIRGCHQLKANPNNIISLENAKHLMSSN